MLHLEHSTVYYWYNGPADMSKGFDALCGMVTGYMQANVLTGGMYIFVNRKRNQIKLPTLCKALHNVDRKNYLFAGSHAAALRSAIFYTLLATCKNYHVNPTEWMNDVLTRIAGYPINKIQELLPQNWTPNK
jgi:hypothetical protein